MAREHDVALVDADRCGHLDRRAPRGELHRRFPDAGEQSGVAIRADEIITRLRGAVEDGHADLTSPSGQRRAVLDQLHPGGRGRKFGQDRRIADDPVLHFLEHARGVAGPDQGHQVDCHLSPPRTAGSPARGGRL